MAVRTLAQLKADYAALYAEGQADDAITTARVRGFWLNFFDSVIDDSSILEAAFTGAIDTTQLTDDAVTGAKIASGAVDSDQLAEDSVGVDEIASNAVTSDAIASRAVTGDKIAIDSATQVAVRGLLEALTGNTRLDASAIKNLPSGGGTTYTLTRDDMWDVLGGLTGAVFTRTRLGSQILSGNAGIWHDTGVTIPATGVGRVTFTLGSETYYRLVDYAALHALTHGSLAQTITVATQTIAYTLGSRTVYLGLTSGNGLLYGSPQRVTDTVAVDTLSVGGGGTAPPSPAASYYYGISSDSTFVASEFTLATRNAQNGIAVPEPGANSYLAFAIPSTADDLTYIGTQPAGGNANIIHQMVKVEGPVVLGSVNHKYWRTSAAAIASSIGQTWYVE